jgi:hypothetical protein
LINFPRVQTVKKLGEESFTKTKAPELGLYFQVLYI